MPGMYIHTTYIYYYMYQVQVHNIPDNISSELLFFNIFSVFLFLFLFLFIIFFKKKFKCFFILFFIFFCKTCLHVIIDH